MRVAGHYGCTAPRHSRPSVANATTRLTRVRSLLARRGRSFRISSETLATELVDHAGPAVDDESLTAFLDKHRAAVIGGAIVRDISLLFKGHMPEEGGHGLGKKLGEFPVLPCQTPDLEGARAQLFMPSDADRLPVFVFPEDYIAPPGYEHVKDLPLAAGLRTACATEAQYVNVYSMSGNIDNFWGIKGLTATLHKHKNVYAKSRTEKVTLNPKSLAFRGQPLASLFPFIDNDDFKKLPLANLELTYSSGYSDHPIHKPGLYLEVDVQLRDSLHFVGDAIKRLFGSPDHPPTIHLSAWLSETRNWSQRPTNLDKVVFQGYFKNMAFKPWNIVEFETMGIELTVTKSGSSWDFGFGFIGKAMISNIPEAGVPVGLSYRIAREADDDDSKVKALGMGRKWSLTLVAQDWRHVFGFQNVDMMRTMLTASFREGSFNSSVKLDIMGLMKIGDDISLEVQGQFAKGWMHNITWTWLQFQSQLGVPLAQDDHFLQASIGNLTLSDIVKLHSRIALGRELSEQDVSERTAGEVIKLQNATIKVSCTKYLGEKRYRKVLEVLGVVTVGDITSYSASLTFATDGITITGGVGNIQIPGTSLIIEKAGLKFSMDLREKPQQAMLTNSTNNTQKAGTCEKEGSVSTKHKTSLSVLGIVKYQNVIFEAGLYLANKKDKDERDWLAFGLAGHLRLRDIWPAIPEDSFLNLQLENVAIIASSRDRPHTTYGKQRDHGSGNWDALVEIGAYHYPISKGLQICATIPSFQQLEQLNNGQKMEGLMLVLSISPDDEVKVSMILPTSFRVQLSESASFSDFSAALVVDESVGPQLQLTATLTVKMEGSDPIVVHGLLVGTIIGLEGELYMDPASKWVNPFGINEALVVSNLGIGTSFSYATVSVTGPDRFALRGQVDIGSDIHGRLDVGMDVTKAAAVLQVELSSLGLNLTDIARMAGTLTQCTTLCNKPATWGLKPSVIVFHDLRLYLSSGARFLGQFYPRGVHVRGTLEFLGNTAFFEGLLTTDGLVFTGQLLDVVSLGGLQVSSLSSLRTSSGGDDKDRGAMAHVELTRTRQRVFFDGAIQYRGFVLGALVNVDLQKGHLYAEMELAITGSLRFALKGSLDPGGLLGSGDGDLNAVEWMFEGDLKPDVVAAVAEGIIEAINILSTMAKHAIEDAEAQLRGRLRELQDDLARRELELDELRRQSDEELRKRQEDIDSENEALRQLVKELDEAERRYRDQKEKRDAKDAEVQEQRRKRDQAEWILDRKIREMKKEYNDKIQKQKADRAHWESEKRELIEKKNASWGDALRRHEASKKSQAWWAAREVELWKLKESYERELSNCPWWETPYWAIRLSAAAVELEEAHAAKTVTTDVLLAVEAVTNTQAFITVEQELNHVADQIAKVESALERLVTEGPVGFIEEMTRDEKRDLQHQIEVLEGLIKESKELEEELRMAETTLEETRGRLSREQEEARRRIAKLEADIKLRPFEEDYRTKQQDFDRFKAHADLLIAALETTRDVVDIWGIAAQKVIRFVERGMPRIKEIKVRASSKALAAHEPLRLEITASWLGEDYVCHVEWAPEEDAHVLYRSAATKLVEFGGSQD